MLYWLKVQWISSQACIPCPAGHYCQNLTSSPVPCADGTFSLGSAVSCTECPAGYECPTNSKDKAPMPCVAGKYSNRSATVCTDCDHGYLCSGRNVSPRPPAGLCPIGYHCDGLKKVACPSGKYGNITGAPDEASGCQTCPAGYFCPSPTIGYPTYRFVISWLETRACFFV